MTGPRANEVRRARRAADITQAELARRVGIARQTLVEIEKGGNASLATAMRLARQLDTSAEALFPTLVEEADRRITACQST